MREDVRYISRRTEECNEEFDKRRYKRIGEERSGETKKTNKQTEKGRKD